MQGCRGLTEEEIVKIRNWFTTELAKGTAVKRRLLRNRAMFFLGLSTGCRISELLSLRVGDVWEYDEKKETGKVLEGAYLKKENTKKKVAGRSLHISSNAHDVLLDYLNDSTVLKRSPEMYLFPSSHNPATHLSKEMALLIYKEIFKECGITRTAMGKLGTHVTRKTFCQTMFNLLDKDHLSTAKVMGYKNVGSVSSYIPTDKTRIEKALNDKPF